MSQASRFRTISVCCDGDELFQTVESGGFTFKVGSTPERKEKLDTVFTTSLAIEF